MRRHTNSFQVINITVQINLRESDRQTDRQTDRQRHSLGQRSIYEHHIITHCNTVLKTFCTRNGQPAKLLVISWRGRKKRSARLLKSRLSLGLSENIVDVCLSTLYWYIEANIHGPIYWKLTRVSRSAAGNRKFHI